MGIKRLWTVATIHAVFPAGMTGWAEGLPIGWIPEQSLIAFVGLDVVDDVGCGDLAIQVAQLAERMLTQEAQPCPLPAFREVQRPIQIRFR